MRVSGLIEGAALAAALVVGLSSATALRAQDAPAPPAARARAEGPARPGGAAESAESITEDYERALLQLDRNRLDRLGRLAAKQRPDDAAATYEQLFRLAIAGNLFREAEPAANAVLNGAPPSRSVAALAHLVKIIAETDRGDHEGSLKSLQRAVAAAEKAAANGEGRQVVVPTPELVAICDAYYQRLLQGGRFDIARKALSLLRDRTERPALKAFLSSRLDRLAQVGRAAPALSGTAVDGKPFNLANERGNVVLIVFWASWCLPCSEEVDHLRRLDGLYKSRGLRIVGVNLDEPDLDGQQLKDVPHNVRRFLLDHNITWPNLVNGSGEHDYARAFGVSEIPANVLVGRDGTIVHIDLTRKNLEAVVGRAVGR